MRLGLASALLLVLGLAACVRPPEEGVPTAPAYDTDPFIAPPEVDTTRASEPKAPPVPAPRPDQTEPPEPMRELAHLGSPLLVDDLVGREFEEVRALLGSPALDEVRQPARVWSYNAKSCVLSLFFYPQVGGDRFRVLTYEVAGEGLSPQDREAARRCFSELLAQRDVLSKG